LFSSGLEIFGHTLWQHSANGPLTKIFSVLPVLGAEREKYCRQPGGDRQWRPGYLPGVDSWFARLADPIGTTKLRFRYA
jgi:hypothetical protein